jgi:hypothetical protein
MFFTRGQCQQQKKIKAKKDFGLLVIIIEWNTLLDKWNNRSTQTGTLCVRKTCLTNT